MNYTIGHFPKESGFIAKYRKHQGWWRAFVLNLEEGTYSKENKSVCNRINNGHENPHLKNFLSEEIVEVVKSCECRTSEGFRKNPSCISGTGCLA